MSNAKLKKDDGYDVEIFTTGYPRSGSTWLVRTLCDLFNAPLSGAPAAGPQLTDFASYIEGNFIIRKTHWYTEQYPKIGYNGKPSKIILVIRDPRDMIVSMMHYRNQTIIKDTIMSVAKSRAKERSLEAYIDGWFANPPDAIVRYEDMMYESVKTYEILWATIYGDSRAPDYEKFTNVNINQGFEKHAPNFPHSMRKGIVGDWKNHFSKDDIELADYVLGDVMKKMGYESWE